MDGIKNPCWKEAGGDKLFCTPYFFIVGISKSGTTDLYHRISLHPDVVTTKKEQHFFSRTRFEGSENFTTYLHAYEKIARIVQFRVEKHMSLQIIAGDASPSYFFHNEHWQKYSGNEGCTEPRVLAAHHILHLNPKAKVIIIYRDPVQRLYSRYLFYCGNRERCWQSGKLGPAAFHRAVVDGVAKYLDCFQRWSLRHCAYNTSLAQRLSPALRLQESMYSVFLEDWLRIVPRHQLHVIRFENYVSDETSELEKIYSFLGLRELTGPVLQGIIRQRIANRGKFYTKGPMLPKTYRILQRFYHPFTKMFEWLLHKNGL